VEETGKLLWDRNLDNAAFVKEHFNYCEEDFDASHMGTIERVAWGWVWRAYASWCWLRCWEINMEL
jgi:hypothetical protein